MRCGDSLRLVGAVCWSSLNGFTLSKAAVCFYCCVSDPLLRVCHSCNASRCWRLGWCWAESVDHVRHYRGRFACACCHCVYQTLTDRACCNADRGSVLVTARRCDRARCGPCGWSGDPVLKESSQALQNAGNFGACSSGKLCHFACDSWRFGCGARSATR
ncbi:hypothetical protein D3C80_931460 [compost metagenome]